MSSVYVSAPKPLSGNEERKLVFAAAELLMLVCSSRGCVQRNRATIAELVKALEFALGPETGDVEISTLPFTVQP